MFGSLLRLSVACALAGAFGVFSPALSFAEVDEETQNQIDQTQLQITALRNQIEQLTIQLNNTTEQKLTLENAVKALDLQIQTLTKQITLTNTQITQKDKQIRVLSGNISDTQGRIESSQDGIAAGLRTLAVVDGEPMMAALLGGGTLSSFFDQAVTLGTLRGELQNHVEDLSALKSDLADSKAAAQTRRRELAALKADLNSQKQGLAIAKSEQNKLLGDTKDRESNYQAQIAQKRAEERAFEAELVRLAEGLGLADIASAPAPKKGLIGWPLDNVFITQYFGNTSFAQSGAYNGKGHNGIDFRAAIGTPARSVSGGTVMEINQGAVRNCQYGKWVLVKHDNGLASLYGHLSNIAVSKGERVGRGEVVGYAGNTGYATGPHLHLTLYIASAISFKQYTCYGGQALMVPIAPLNAYLNPLNYLP